MHRMELEVRTMRSSWTGASDKSQTGIHFSRSIILQKVDHGWIAGFPANTTSVRISTAILGVRSSNPFLIAHLGQS